MDNMISLMLLDIYLHKSNDNRSETITSGWIFAFSIVFWWLASLCLKYLLKISKIILKCLVRKGPINLWQNVCLNDKHILINRYSRCDCKLWNANWLYNVFGYFHTLLMAIHVWSIVPPPNFHRLCI